MAKFLISYRYILREEMQTPRYHLPEQRTIVVADTKEDASRSFLSRMRETGFDIDAIHELLIEEELHDDVAEA